MKFITSLLVMLSVLSSALSQNPLKPSLAVLKFTAGPGIEIGQANILGDTYSTQLDQKGTFNILPRYNMNRVLANLVSEPDSKEAGRILKVDYVISGHVEKKDNKYWLNTSLFDAKTGSTIKTANTYYNGELDKFLKLAAPGNITILFAQNTPAATAQEAPSTTSTQPTPPQPSQNTFSTSLLDQWIKNRIELGADISHFFLLDKEKESFLGSINMLKEDQVYFPYPFINVGINEEIWIQISYNKFRAITWTKAELEHNEPGYTDGSIELAGPTLSLQYRHPLDQDLNIFAEAGIALYEAAFIHDPAWRDANGAINSHIMEFYNTTGFFIGAEGDLLLKNNWHLTLQLTYTKVSADMTYYLYGRERADRTFPLSNLSFGIGTKYDF